METLDTNKKSFIARYAKILLFIATFFGSTSSPVAAVISANAICIGFYRSTISLPFFILIVFCNKENREAFKKLDLKGALLSLLSGFCLFIHFYSWFTAAKNTNIASAVVLGSLHPLVVLFITVICYKRKVSFKTIIAIVGAIIGGVIIAVQDVSVLSGGKLYGNLMALLAGISVGVYFAIGDKVQKKVKGTVYVLLVFFACWVSFTVSMIVTKTPVFGYPTKDYLWMLYLAIACQIGCHALMSLCIGHAGSLYASTVNAAEPVFSIAIAILLLSQLPTMMEIIGCIVVVGSILLYNKFESESGH